MKLGIGIGFNQVDNNFEGKSCSLKIISDLSYKLSVNSLDLVSKLTCISSGQCFNALKSVELQMSLSFFEQIKHTVKTFR